MTVGDEIEGHEANLLPIGSQVRHPRGMVIQRHEDFWLGVGFGPGRLRFDTMVVVVRIGLEAKP